MSNEKIRVGISQGDINGIGLEIILKTLSESAITEICTPVIFSSNKTISHYKKNFEIEDLNFNLIKDLNQINSKRINLYNCYEEDVQIEFGKVSESAGKFAFLSLEKACEALQSNHIDVLVTAPINKNTIQNSTFNFPGHTEYLAHKFNAGNESLMILCSDELRVALVTGHVPIAQIASKINIDTVVNKINQFNKTLQKDFNIRKPKIAVLSLNPHAGDNGVIGKEDDEIIKPAIDKLKDKILVYGPYPADGFFGNLSYKKFDGVLAMYHDQGLIPFKSIAFSDGVNFTAGLPIIRTSPDHGTAFDIAGKGLADETSIKKAIYMAIDLYRNRKLNEAISATPLAFGKLKHE